ncbi:hypothetical protein TIFTF001_025237 [Ficus carica]|uniref:Uncharacterized protein n=1 Tax=Ficus carica TaxID=3494 RepID=A0AA88AQX6_FICCA|nr:hypothetical protein TIFTF001_025237 [Ficus carica]
MLSPIGNGIWATWNFMYASIEDTFLPWQRCPTSWSIPSRSPSLTRWTDTKGSSTSTSYANRNTSS